MKRLACWFALLLAAACNTTAPPVPASKPGTVDMKEPRRMVGTESNVRVDAEIYGEDLVQGASIAIKYDITNERSSAILIADLIPQTNYDPETRTVTIDIGSDIPGEQFLPRLVSVPSGERRSFKTGAHINIQLPVSSSSSVPRPKALQIRVNFLGNPAPFVKLIDIPEKAIHDPQLAAELFPKWVEGNETVTTNALPMRWRGSRSGVDETDTPRQTGNRRRPGG
ncbi:MAG TPA: hypothetical protein VLC46_13640 [Thermoanaerobaculia bacterium]|jgi:hypothetical protein|nr:hypothetical protein [Thermoanaerobaculia bacterium]